MDTIPREHEREPIKCVTFLCTDRPTVISFTEQYRDIGLAVHYLGPKNFIVASFQENREKTDIARVVNEITSYGISYDNNNYHFFGHSNSQLKSRSCYFYRATSSEIERIINEIGTFPDEVAKKAKYIGLLFTGIKKLVEISHVRDISIEEDIKIGDYLFTDGCGSISKGVAMEIARSLSLSTVPSVFQIRYKVVAFPICILMYRDLKGFL